MANNATVSGVLCRFPCNSYVPLEPALPIESSHGITTALDFVNIQAFNHGCNGKAISLRHIPHAVEMLCFVLTPTG